MSVEAHRARLELVDEVYPHEHVLRADTHLEARDRGIPAPFRELDDEILDPPDLRTGGVQHRAAQYLRQHQPAFISRLALVIDVSVSFLICH